MKLEDLIKKSLIKNIVTYNFDKSILNKIKVVLTAATLNTLYSKYGSNAKIGVVYNRLDYIIALTDEHGNKLFAMPDKANKRIIKIYYLFR